MNRTTPYVVHEVVYDTLERCFYVHGAHTIIAPLPTKIHHSSFILPLTFLPGSAMPKTANEDILCISQPTVCMNHFHSCFFHAYLEEAIPLLSILAEVYPSELLRRDIQLFILRDMFYENVPAHERTEGQKNFISDKRVWERSIIHLSEGGYIGAYGSLQKSISRHPGLFETFYAGPRFIRFDTLLFGGNEDYQRCLHNSLTYYPERTNLTKQDVTDCTLQEWFRAAKGHLRGFLRVPTISDASSTLLVARKQSRSFFPKDLTRLCYILGTEQTYLEEYSLEEQIYLFKEAKLVLAPHGSGLAHLIWCRPGTVVVEIFGTDDPRAPIFKRIADFFGLRYFALFCSAEKVASDSFFEIPQGIFLKLEEIVNNTLLN